MKKILLLIVALFASLSVWAIEQDSEGYYLIGSAEDWDAFAAIINETPTANAKMTADVNLGDDQTMIGTSSAPYQGVFDGQAHKLTVNYSATDFFAAPFSVISGASIKKLHVDGSINTTSGCAGGVVGNIPSGTNSIDQCLSTVKITSTQGGREWIGGFVGQAINRGTIININDCLCQADITANWAANFIGIMRDYGHANVNNSLSTATCTNATQFNSIYHYIYGDGTTTNTYIVNSDFTNYDHGVAGTIVTADQLADGTIATALQAGRTEEVWVQDETTGAPMLKIFLQEDNPTGIEEVNAAKPKSGHRYNLMGQPVGKDYKGIVIEDGQKIIVR